MNATMSLDETKHHPVMLDQILSIISPQHGGTFIDCTFGGGGYSHAILKYPDTREYAIDRDKLTLQYANALLKKFPKRFSFFQNKFSNLNKIIDLKISQTHLKELYTFLIAFMKCNINYMETDRALVNMGRVSVNFYMRKFNINNCRFLSLY